MPLLTLSSLEAAQNQGLSHANWPESQIDERWFPITTPTVHSSFRLTREEPVYCMGSCFARNVEEVFRSAGFEVLSQKAVNPYADALHSNGCFMNRYSPFAMLNELQWALLDEPFPEDAFLPTDVEGVYQDPHANVDHERHDLARLRELRDRAIGNVRLIEKCRVLVLTLGLVECWYDRAIGRYTNRKPNAYALAADPRRFEFHVLSHDDVSRAMDGIMDILDAKAPPSLKILITTSPVPLGVTFRGIDVFTANTYSKSLLRVAAEEFSLRHRERVTYFPSYESIMLTNRLKAFDMDTRHVAAGAAGYLMQLVVDTLVQPE